MTAASNKPLPSVGVVIPTYNRWPMVCRAIDSVLRQTYPHVECIVVDDHSTDGTVQQLCDLYGGRIKLILQPQNREKSAARNAGVRAVETDYVCMLDSDDELTATSVADRVELFMKDTDFNGVAYGLSFRGEGPLPEHVPDKTFPAGDVLVAYVKAPFLDNNGFLLSRQSMLEHGMYREDLTNREDMEMLIRLASRLEFRFCGSYVAHVHVTPVSARSDFSKYLRQGQRVIDYLRADETVVQRLGRHLERFVFQERMELARALYKTKQFSEYRHAAIQLFNEHPGRALLQGRLWRRFLRTLMSTESRSGGTHRK